MLPTARTRTAASIVRTSGATLASEDDGPRPDAPKRRGGEAHAVSREVGRGDFRRVASPRIRPRSKRPHVRRDPDERSARPRGGGDQRGGEGEVEEGGVAAHEPAAVEERLTQLGNPGDDRGKVEAASALGDVFPRPPPEHRVMYQGGGAKRRRRAGATGSPPEPDVLRERLAEARVEPLLEAVQALEQLAAHEQARALVQAELVGHPDGAIEGLPRDSGIGADGPLDELRLTQRRQPLGQPPRGWNAVGVGERQRVAPGMLGAQVPCPGRPNSGCSEHPRSGAGLGRHRRRPVRGAVVHDDDLEFPVEGLPGERGQRGADGSRGVPGRDDDADRLHRRENLDDRSMASRARRAAVRSSAVAGAGMREFWDARAEENAYYFIDNRLDYRDPDSDAFWTGGREALDTVIE